MSTTFRETNMLQVKGRVAVVTGASSGIGRAVAMRLARRGARVTLVGRSASALEIVAEAIRGVGGEARTIPCDVRQVDAVAAAHTRILAEMGPPAMLVNAAGFGVWKGFLEVSEAEHRAMMDTTYWGSFNWIRAVLPGMIAGRSGNILNVAAASARIPLPVTSGFSATTAALIALSESLHRELMGSGVRVSCLSPGSVKTDFWDPERIPPGGIPWLVRFAPKVSAESVAREAELCIRLGVGFRTFPIFVAALARANALWYRAGDLILSRWFFPGLLLLIALRVASRIW
jgi:short-subunit dehydrogenase